MRQNLLLLRLRAVVVQRSFSTETATSSSSKKSDFGTVSNGFLSNFVQDLSKRELICKSYPNDILTTHLSSLRNAPNVLYAGFDPTADSLHIGNLLILLNLLRSSRFGCESIAIVGGATASIGDPSGQTTDRVALDTSFVQTNTDRITEQIAFIAKNVQEMLPVDSTPLRIINNNEWYSKMSMTEYLRMCRPLRVGEMLRMGAIKSRMRDNNGVSFTEFSYQTMQSYDWLKLSQMYGCRFQLGGSDQLGHLDLGAHFIGRVDDHFAAGVCLPLVTDASGNKLGKSTGNGVWLSASRTSPYAFFQFFRQLHDTEAERMLWQFSLRPLEEIKQVVDEHKSNLGRWVAQDALASEMTRAVHGETGLEKAKMCTRVVFNGSFDDLSKLDADTLISLFGNVIDLNISDVRTVSDLATRTRNDKQPVAQLISKGAFKLNGKKETDAGRELSEVDRVAGGQLSLVGWGKRKFQLVKWI